MDRRSVRRAPDELVGDVIVCRCRDVEKFGREIDVGVLAVAACSSHHPNENRNGRAVKNRAVHRSAKVALLTNQGFGNRARTHVMRMSPVRRADPVPVPPNALAVIWHKQEARISGKFQVHGVHCNFMIGS